METEKKGDFSQGSIMKILLRLAVPMTMAQLINVLYNVMDRMFIGRIGGESMDALTGVGVCLPMITVVIAFANLVGTGGAPLFSIERGQKNEEEAEAILGNSVTLLILFAVGLTVFGMIFKKPVLRLLGASSVTLPYANEYITIYLLGTVFVLLSLGLNNFINAQGFAKTGMCTVAIGAGLNIVLDPLFIFVFHMGVRGAAVATVISQFAAAVWTVHFLTGKKALIRIRKKQLRLQGERVKKMLALGLSGFTMSVTNSVVQMVCNATLQLHGGDVYVGIMTIINSVREIVSLPVSGFSGAAQPVLGYNYGAKLYERVKRTIRDMGAVLLIYTLAAWGIVSLFPQFFYPFVRRKRRNADAGSLFYAHLFLWVLFYGISVYRSGGICRFGQTEAGNVLLHIQKNCHCCASYAAASGSRRIGSTRCVLGGTHFKCGGRSGMLYDNDADCVPETWKNSSLKKKYGSFGIACSSRSDGK